MSDKLKECPFCGGEAKIDTAIVDGFKMAYVSCKKCDAFIGLGGDDNIRRVTEAWNKRSNWHTGTPPDEGDYLCWTIYKEHNGAMVYHWSDKKSWELVPNYPIEDERIIAWQKITPYEGEEVNG